MTKIVIGKSGHRDVGIDRKILMTTRLLITSDSGGGKTWLLKRLIEQAFGQVGIIVIDPEGEFAPLRTKFDFFLVSKGAGGDTPADIRTAEKVALTLLKGRASAICDIYDMPASERHIWVQRFLDALLEAPKELRHPYLVIVDEAHMFCPEHGKGESVASDAMRGLATRGRKRELCGIYATQRLSSLGKDLTGMCLNRLVGPTFESINQKRAADELGIQKPEQKQFFAEVKMLEPGNFYALGRAITKDLELVHIGPIETPHGQEARQYELKPPPPTAKVREWLKELGDLPKQAEEEARTAAEFKKQIRDLKVQLRMQPKEAAVIKQVSDPTAIERAVLADRKAFLPELRRALSRALTGPVHAVSDNLDSAIARIDLRLEAKPSEHKIPGAEIHKGESVHKTLPPEGRMRQEAARNHPRPDVSSNGSLTRPQQRVLAALAEFAGIGIETPSRSMVASWLGVKAGTGSFKNYLSELRTAGLIHDPKPDCLALTSEGQAAAPEINAAMTTEELLSRSASVLGATTAKILRIVHGEHPAYVHREVIAETLGISPDTGSFKNYISELRTAGMIEDGPDKSVRAADWLFI